MIDFNSSYPKIDTVSSYPVNTKTDADIDTDTCTVSSYPVDTKPKHITLVIDVWSDDQMAYITGYEDIEKEPYTTEGFPVRKVKVEEIIELLIKSKLCKDYQF